MPMTNEQKYKTAEERVKAFHGYCRSHKTRCEDCPLKQFQADETCVCFAYWLALEAEEKPELCPFCDGVATVCEHSPYFDVECKCGYVSSLCDTREIAISAHNRVAHAVRAAKESEMK